MGFLNRIRKGRIRRRLRKDFPDQLTVFDPEIVEAVREFFPEEQMVEVLRYIDTVVDGDIEHACREVERLKAAVSEFLRHRSGG
ncbi:MAG: hypothetical protein HWN66_13900 [Candidatus Helarchaeota archaeon]|nr:hypothetical protein [Candidatus Helarchaeota archaeon]